MSEEFVTDTKKANKLTNQRFENRVIDVVPFDIEDLRKEIERPIYGLTKTIINNQLNNVNSREEFDRIMNALKAAEEYIKRKEAKGEVVANTAATKSAIKDNWKPSQNIISGEIDQKKSKEQSDENDRQKKKEEEYQKLQNDPLWLKIQNKIKVDFGEENWNRWFSEIKIFSLNEKEITFNAPSKFLRDWITKEFLQKSIMNEKGRAINLKSVIKEVCPSIEVVLIVCIISSV